MTKLLWLPESADTDAPLCLARHGEHWASAPLPAPGERFIAVVPAGVYQWHVIELPALPRKARAAAAASMIEPHLMSDADACVFHVLPLPDGKRHAVAVLSSEWVAAADNWLRELPGQATRWVPETALFEAREEGWVLFHRGGEWLLLRGPFDHRLLDHSTEHEPPQLLRAALADATPSEVRVAGLPASSHLAERHLPSAPLWLATLGLRARSVEGTAWLNLPDKSIDFSPGTRRAALSLPLPSLKSLRLPALGLLGLLALHTAGLTLQYLQWKNEADTLRRQVDEKMATLSERQSRLSEPAGHVHLAEQLEHLATLGLAPGVLTRLDFEGGTLSATLTPKSVDMAGLQARAQALGGQLTTAAGGVPVLRLNAKGSP
jgi:hypothetical protein